MTKRICVDDYRSIVFVTGAGISVASGLQPYRGPGGLWEQDPDAADLATAAALRSDPAAVWRLLAALRPIARDAAPNPAHRAIAAVALAAPERRATVTVITQNIDGLHQRAGTPDVLELHGSLFRSRCSDPACTQPAHDDDAPRPDGPTPCARCGAPSRVDVVLFDEPLDAGVEHRAKRALRECDLFIAVGTSGTVSPASHFARAADYAGARTVLVNLEPMRPVNPYFHEQILGRAEELLPALLGPP
jgi:NAD-dependent deacetylase